MKLKTIKCFIKSLFSSRRCRGHLLGLSLCAGTPDRPDSLGGHILEVYSSSYLVLHTVIAVDTTSVIILLLLLLHHNYFKKNAISILVISLKPTTTTTTTTTTLQPLPQKIIESSSQPRAYYYYSSQIVKFLLLQLHTHTYIELFYDVQL